MLLTPNLSLKKPEGADNVNIDDFNGNADILDTAVAAKETPAGAQAKVDAHANRTDNPHGTTAAQVGAETPTGAQTKVNAHANLTNNPHGVTAAQAGAIPASQKGMANGVASLDASGTVPDAQIPSTIARDSELSAHTSRTDNPHATTAAQVGAIPTSQRGAANGVASLDGSGDVPDAQIPAGIARTSSPTFSGTPTAPTAAAGTNTTQIATTEFVRLNKFIAGTNVSSGGGILCVAVGTNALANNTGSSNTAVGYGALDSNTSSASNTAIGNSALGANSTGAQNTAVGKDALIANTIGNRNTAVGDLSLDANIDGTWNTAVGSGALGANTSGARNTAVGLNSLSANTTFINTSGFGHNAQVTADNQVQLGDSATTTYVYGTVQNRSDERDKADIRDTVLGLDFIQQLRPVDFKWNYREDYFVEEVGEDGSSICTQIENDGSKTRTRYHHGLIAQEVEAVINETGVDFGGYQDHSLCGGHDVKSIGYDELIAPMIKAIQELKAELDAYKADLP